MLSWRIWHTSCTGYSNTVLRMYKHSPSFRHHVSLQSRCFRILLNQKYLILLYQTTSEIHKELYLKTTGCRKRKKTNPWRWLIRLLSTATENNYLLGIQTCTGIKWAQVQLKGLVTLKEQQVKRAVKGLQIWESCSPSFPHSHTPAVSMPVSWSDRHWTFNSIYAVIFTTSLISAQHVSYYGWKQK